MRHLHYTFSSCPMCKDVLHHRVIWTPYKKRDFAADQRTKLNVFDRHVISQVYLFNGSVDVPIWASSASKPQRIGTMPGPHAWSRTLHCRRHRWWWSCDGEHCQLLRFFVCSLCFKFLLQSQLYVLVAPPDYEMVDVCSRYAFQSFQLIWYYVPG